MPSFQLIAVCLWKSLDSFFWELLIAKRQNEGTMLVDVVPGVSRCNRKVNDNVVTPDWNSVPDLQEEWFSLCANPGMDASMATHKTRYTKGTPDTRGPPPQIDSFDVVECWSRREGMDDPWVAA